MLIFDRIGQPYGYKGFDFRNMTPNEIILWYYGKGKFKLSEDDKWLWYRVLSRQSKLLKRNLCPSLKKVTLNKKIQETLRTIYEEHSEPHPQGFTPVTYYVAYKC